MMNWIKNNERLVETITSFVVAVVVSVGGTIVAASFISGMLNLNIF